MMARYDSIDDLPEAHRGTARAQMGENGNVRPRRIEKPVARSEHNEQVALFRWRDENLHTYPELENMFAIPNGGHRHKATAGKLKAEGVRAGVSDIFLPYPVQTLVNLYPPVYEWRHGLWIEMKKSDRKNHASISQLKFIDAMNLAGYEAVVCYSCDEAIEAIDKYLSGVNT